MHNYFGYIRVSTARQGERGVSLQEQHDAIARYAQANGITVCEWFEERITAAKTGRPVFSRMLDKLRDDKARGIVIHKIDRGARNLRDWACLGELLDAGMDVRFAHEALDMKSRGGRLAADIQAVVAADFIRNLKDETRKGMYGRLKQGLLPLPAPLGYLDNGGGKPKTVCPISGPLIRRAFEAYATGQYSLHMLADEMHELGVRSRFGARVPHGAWARIIRNPFYMGLIRLKSTEECFQGIHEPLITSAIYDSVQEVLAGRMPKRTRVHDFTYRRIFHCRHCGNLLIGERQKGHVYYRCHTRNCRRSCLREEALESALLDALRQLEFSPQEIRLLRMEAEKLCCLRASNQDQLLDSLRLRNDATRSRLERLTDAYIDRMLTKDAFESRRKDLIREQLTIADEIRRLESGDGDVNASIESILELAISVYSTYELSKATEKRELVKNIFSNRTVAGKSIGLTMRKPYRAMADRPTGSCGAPSRSTTRTWEKWLMYVARLFVEDEKKRKVDQIKY